MPILTMIKPMKAQIVWQSRRAFYGVTSNAVTRKDIRSCRRVSEEEEEEEVKKDEKKGKKKGKKTDKKRKR